MHNIYLLHCHGEMHIHQLNMSQCCLSVLSLPFQPSGEREGACFLLGRTRAQQGPNLRQRERERERKREGEVEGEGGRERERERE